MTKPDITIQTNPLKMEMLSQSNTISTTGNNRELWLRGAGDGEFTGSISNGVNTDPTVVHKQDSGTWTFSGAR